MSAERIPEQQTTGEVIYLVIPPSAPATSAPSLWQRWHYAIWSWWNSESGAEVSLTARALVGAVGFTLCGVAALYGLYMVKSMLGIDLVSDKHLEDFVPLPGYRR